MNVRQNQVPTSEFRSPNSASSRRRGVTLLFVISMIVLFLLMGTTFVVVSNDYLRAAKRRNASGGVNAGAVTREEGQQLVMQSFLEAVRGPSLDNTANPLRGHDLLGDMYGYGIEAVVSDAALHPSTHFLEVEFDFDYSVGFPAEEDFPRSLLTGNRLLSLFNENATGRFPKPATFTTQPAELQIPGHFNGRVLTVVSGEHRGLTTRIFHSSSASAELGQETHTFFLQPISAGSLVVAADLVGETVIINGRAFAGTGAGRFTEASEVGAPALNREAGRCNRVATERDEMYSDYLVRVPLGTTAGEPNSQSTNEPWDAADEQNMFLATIEDRTTGGTQGELEEAEITPSFFRSSLTGTRRNFSAFATSVNSALSRTNDILVDNDNDGLNDGIWIDLGLPVRSTPDGEYIKPLVSYLILDMDGRLNINAHGNLDEAAIIPGADLLGAATLPSGLGFGPAEVSLGTLISAANLPEVFNERYGSNADQLPGFPGANRDRKAIYKRTGYPDGPRGNHFGSQFDWYGRYSLGFTGDTASPLFANMPSLISDTAGGIINNPLNNSPYEVDLIAGSNADDLFSVGELERFLRPQDRDSVLLDKRLEDVLEAQLASLANDDERNLFRKLFTTSSFEVPAIPVDINRRLYEAFDAGLTEPQKSNLMGFLLSPEVRRGLPMNINRIFGDGQDDNIAPGDGVVDEPFEEEGDIDGIDNGQTVSLDVNNNGQLDSGETTLADSSPGLDARRNFARRLFVLLVLITEYEDRSRDGTISAADDFFDFNGDGNPNGDDWLAHRQMLAQWCANVVDFRDPDSIMTGIEFDLNPFDGWDVDGSVQTSPTSTAPAPPPAEMTMPANERFVAWGMERPELLITETAALHDRRTQDRDDEPSPGDAFTTDSPPDTDFDSLFVPNASAFFELYNPWISDRNSTPVELSDPRSNIPGPGVDLTRLDDADAAPVWRFLIVDPTGLSGTDAARFSADFELQIDSQLQMLTVAVDSAPAISRIVYFTDPTAGPNLQFTGERVYYPRGDGVSDRPILNPGEYAVIGSGANPLPSGGFATYLGRRDSGGVTADPLITPTDLDMTQRIELDPDLNRVTVSNPAGAPVTEEASVFAINTVADDGMGTGTPDARSLGLSDPIQGYARASGQLVEPIVEGDGFYFVDAGGNPLVLDMPIDQDLSDNWTEDPINRDGLTTGYRVVLLQRLANPLQPYDINVNPYRTIDSSSVDLFAFNGLEDESAIVTRRDVAAGGTAFRPDALGTFERGEYEGNSSADRNLVWRTSVYGEVDAVPSTTVNVDGAPATAPSGHVLDQPFIHSLGRLNDFYDNRAGVSPFPWLAWNNRPFANRFELANVPYTSPGWLTRLFSIPASMKTVRTEEVFSASIHTGAGLDDPGEPTEAMPFASLMADEQTELRAVIHPNAFGFAHLLNFAADAQPSDRLASIMDFVEVPSRFAGTEQYVNTAVGELTDSTATPTAEDDFGYYLSAPFDELSEYRYPGKINLNTVSSEAVWNAVLGAKQVGVAGPYADPTLGNLTYDRWRDSLDDNPLRPANAANYTSAATVPGPANAGLFRSSTAGRTVGAEGPFLTDYLADLPSTQPPSNDTSRNAYFRNGIRQRLGSIATNRSSVFAIWVTVGYFEWDPESNGFRPGNPEYGTETGTVQRSRGFFMFDRSIPMAYEPGVDHNIDRGILLQSLIE